MTPEQFEFLKFAIWLLFLGSAAALFGGLAEWRGWQ